jgi:uncharacterized protein YggE
MQQMVERPWGVVAYGAADVKAMPDLVRARFKVSRLEQTPTEAFAVASAAVHAVRQAIREHGLPGAAVDRSRLDLKSLWNYSQDNEFLGYRCQASFAVESGNLEDAESLLVDLVAAGANEIEAVDFDVTGKPEMRAQARKQAVGAARRKAELYAEAAGVRLGAVSHIEDVDPEQSRPHRGHGQSGSTSAEDLAPGHIVVSAAVVLGYSINNV